MDILLLSDVKNIGKKGDIITAKEGFARNFLLPKKLGMIATRETQTVLQRQKEKTQKTSKANESRSREYARQLEGKILTFTKPKTEKGTLYAALTEQDIKEAVHAHIGVSPAALSLSSLHHLKHVGQYSISVDCGHNERATLVVQIT